MRAWGMGHGQWALPNFGNVGACASNCISCRSFVSTNVVVATLMRERRQRQRKRRNANFSKSF